MRRRRRAPGDEPTPPPNRRTSGRLANARAARPLEWDPEDGSWRRVMNTDGGAGSGRRGRPGERPRPALPGLPSASSRLRPPGGRRALDEHLAAARQPRTQKGRRRGPTTKRPPSFWPQKRVAVTGVSRHPKSHVGKHRLQASARARLRRLSSRQPERKRGRGDHSYKDLTSIPGRGRGDRHQAGVRRGHEQRVRRARHQARLDALGCRRNERLEGPTDYGRRHGITVIDGACPLMFGRPPTSGTRSCAACSPAACPSEVLNQRRLTSACSARERRTR